MSKKNIDHSVESRVCFEQLEEWVNHQDVLENPGENKNPGGRARKEGVTPP